MTLLCTQQSKLEDVALGPLLFNFVPLLNSDLLDDTWIQSLHTLEMAGRIENFDDLRAYQVVLEKAPTLRCLVIRAHDFVPQSRNALFDTELKDGLLIGTLLSHLNVSPRQTIGLQSLTLEELPLTYADRTLASFINFSKLGTLCVFFCEDSNTVMRTLTDLHKGEGSRLTRFYYENVTMNSTVFERFLRSSTGLRRLNIISIVKPESFDGSCLLNHTDTLEELVLSLGEADGPASSGTLICGGLIKLLVERCVSLRQLGIALPGISLADGQAGAWEQFGDQIRMLANLSKLATLRILTLPDPGPGLLEGHASSEKAKQQIRSSYLHELDQFATVLFSFIETSKTSEKLPVICFGAWDGPEIFDGHSSLSIEPACYIAATQTNVYGQSHVVAVRTSVVQAGYIEPYNEILGI